MHSGEAKRNPPENVGALIAKNIKVKVKVVKGQNVSMQ
jgi:hypothetical protein